MICVGCKKVALPYPEWRLCVNCMEGAVEALAAKIDPTYDRGRMNEWDTAHAIIARLYGNNWHLPYPN